LEVRAPTGQYRVIGLDPVDTLTSPSGPLWKDCDTLDEALDFSHVWSWLGCSSSLGNTIIPATRASTLNGTVLSFVGGAGLCTKNRDK